MQILITGAKGFMGRNLVETLRQARPDDTLHLIDVRSTPEEWRAAAMEARELAARKAAKRDEA